MDKFTSQRISELAGVKFKPTPVLTEEELALQFDELYELLELNQNSIHLLLDLNEMNVSMFEQLCYLENYLEK